MIDLEKLKKLNAERTPGVFSVDTYAPYEDPTEPNMYAIRYSGRPLIDRIERKEDAEFFCELANSLPAIIAELESLRKVAAAARKYAGKTHLFTGGDCSIDHYVNMACDCGYDDLKLALSALDEVSDVK